MLNSRAAPPRARCVSRGRCCATEASTKESTMMNAERMHQDTDSDQRTMRMARGLRALAATLLVAGLVAAVVAELPLGRSTVADVRAAEGGASPAAVQPAVDPLGIPAGSTISPEEFQDRMPTPSSVIVG